jgi:glutaredoxin
MPNIILYQFEICPFCKNVRDKLKEKNLEYEKIDVEYDRKSHLRKELFNKTGIFTVPIIKIDDKYIGDSNKIISYLDKIG